jgi:hypothetical protein
MNIMIPPEFQIPKTILKYIVIYVVVAGLAIPCYGQTDTVKNYKNTVRINITNPMLFGSKSTIVGYERVINKHQTASIGIGRIGFPRLVGSGLDSLGITSQAHDKGFNISFDYRFYLKKENKFAAPRGVYLGPYYAFNSFSRDVTWDVKTSGYNGKVTTGINLTANLIGVQMGYQFVLWDRMTIDMILMGPGEWFFHMKTKFSTDLPIEEETMLLEKLNQMLKDKFPGSDAALHGGGFDAKKTTSTSAMGFRYMVNVGFRF